jgi:hypothetical protein
MLPLAGSGKRRLVPAPTRMEWEPHLVPARARVGAGAFPFPSLRTFRATIGAYLLAFPALAVALRVLGFDFAACLSIVSQRRLLEQPARYWSWPASEGQFPFPLAPEFWGSWTIS